MHVKTVDLVNLTVLFRKIFSYFYCVCRQGQRSGIVAVSHYPICDRGFRQVGYKIRWNDGYRIGRNRYCELGSTDALHQCLLRFWFRLLGFRCLRRKNFGSGLGSCSGSRQYLALFFNTKVCTNLAFSILELALFPRNLASRFYFIFWPFYSVLCWIRIRVRFGNRNAFRFRFR